MTTALLEELRNHYRSSWWACDRLDDQAGRRVERHVHGATLMRPGIQGLMRDAATGQCALVLSESLDRFSRDLEDTAALSKRLKFEDVRLVTISEGDVSTLQVGFKGTMNALFLQDLADKTRRGLRGRVEDGRSAGGVSYGYRVVRAPDGAPRGDREILAEEARVVERSQDGERLITVANNRLGLDSSSR